MKKPNENSNDFLNLNPAEELSILINFERYVANYGKDKRTNNKKTATRPKIEKSSSFSSAMKFAFAFFLISFSFAAFSQNLNTWKGGTPGQENAWGCAKNWSDYKVPDEFSDVVIPNTSTTTFANPILVAGRVEINSITLDPMAQLTINKLAQLTVYEKAEGISKDNIILHGTLLFLDGQEESKLPVARINVDKQR